MKCKVFSHYYRVFFNWTLLDLRKFDINVVRLVTVFMITRHHSLECVPSLSLSLLINFTLTWYWWNDDTCALIDHQFKMYGTRSILPIVLNIICPGFAFHVNDDSTWNHSERRWIKWHSSKIVSILELYDGLRVGLVKWMATNGLR